MYDSKNTKAFRAGSYARVERKLLSDNPHAEGAQEHIDWKEGWQYESAHIHISGRDYDE